jgi:hypothetical protein
MHVARLRPIERGLDRVFKDAGQNLTWFQYSGTAAHLPEFGLGVSAVYFTAYVQAIIWRGNPREAVQLGGALEQGMLQAMTREQIGKDDILEFATVRYRSAGVPTPAFLGATLFYRLDLRRAE